uniref:Uncharacterized protein n=1 Tax=Arundo donax TaxID=35708 RepID=A0A0A9C624_ARUDO
MIFGFLRYTTEDYQHTIP